jgi:predicted SAM-dependent methyltransferase
MKLHLGCGGVRLDGFVNIDTRSGDAVDIVHNLSQGLPKGVRPGTVTRVETYHFLEHIDRREAKRILEMCFEALTPGGVIVIEVPDFEVAVKDFLTGNHARLKNIFGHNRPDRPSGTDVHMWGYTAETMSKLLTKIGFEVTHTGPGTDYHTQWEPCLRVEARKP